MGMLEKMDTIHTVHLPCAWFPDNFPPTSTIVRSLGLAPNTAGILNNNKNQTRESGTATIKRTIKIKFPCLPLPWRHDCFGIPNHPTCTKGLSAAPPPLLVANRVGADRFPACGILVQRQPFPSAVCVSRFTPPSPRTDDDPSILSHLAIRRHLCLAVKVGERMALAGGRRPGGGQQGGVVCGTGTDKDENEGQHIPCPC